MEHRILIVDDDQIFNALLSDVFMQASYVVQSAFSAEDAMELLSKEKFSLVVTDQRMPGSSGTQLVRHIMKEHKKLPVVMVSGFLSNDDIRQLIHDGIGGVFIKPLNIFQLLKRAAQLIEKRSNPSLKTNHGTSETSDERQAEQSMRSFRGANSKIASNFTKQIQNLRSFTSNLLLVGHAGTNFESICEDLASSPNDTLFLLQPEDFDDQLKLASRLGGLATQENGRLTLVIKQTEQLNDARSETIFAIDRTKAPFDKIGQTTRFIFCLRDNLDDLFDAGKINENLYLFMGTMELKIPSLEELREDIGAMSQAILETRQPSNCKLDQSAVALLKELDWPGGTLQLERVLNDAAAFTPGKIINAASLRDAYEGKQTSTSSTSVANADAGLKEHLAEVRNQYVAAMTTFYGDNVEAAAKALGISTERLHQISKPQ